MGFMHLYMKYTQPLFIQSILPVKGLYDSKVSHTADPMPISACARRGSVLHRLRSRARLGRPPPALLRTNSPA